MNIIIMKMDNLRSDTFRIRFKRNTLEEKIITALTIITFLFAMLMENMSTVYSLPSTDFQLLKDIGNKTNVVLTKPHNEKINDVTTGNNSFIYNQTNGLHHHRKGRRHLKKSHLKHHEHEKNKNYKSNVYNSKLFKSNPSKFDYYPIEPIDIKYRKKDEHIRFSLLTGINKNSKNIIVANSDIQNSRNKRDLLQRRNPQPQKVKRNSINPVINYKYKKSYKMNDKNVVPSITVRFEKIAIPGMYYNAITPHDYQSFYQPNFIISRSSLHDERGPVWDRHPVNMNRFPNSNVIRNEKTKTPLRTPIFEETTTPISAGVTPTSASNGPSNCIWAIVNCCARSNPTIRYSCFEQIGCTGAFWDFNPCGDSWQQVAVQKAEDFFNDD